MEFGVYCRKRQRHTSTITSRADTLLSFACASFGTYIVSGYISANIIGTDVLAVDQHLFVFLFRFCTRSSVPRLTATTSSGSPLISVSARNAEITYRIGYEWTISV
ncbi:hypothetical protein C8J55DRAFT_194232 [Lentinula edodes]|uniref:Uncharacterized protein n=1 Tax=Lentinula lateritia TaxID=40482 RepID=A0A9W8ZYW3_9AGAR|nr:hypothetical protein C8J55DRAFT_194232 [Lentinula edodes]